MSIKAQRDMRYRKSRNKTVCRPKTFKTDESAKAYAEKNGIKNYTLRNLRSPEAKVKKLRIEVSK
jgi:hypothetical protein